MNLTKLRTIGAYTSAFGAGMTLCGAGINLAANICEKRTAKIEMRTFKLEEAKKHEKEVHQHELDILEAQKKTEQAKAEKISRMNQAEFMEMKAKEDARASEKVIAEAAEKIHTSELLAEDKIAKANADCEARLEHMRMEVRKSNNERDAANARYDHINAIFTNRERIQYQMGKINDELAKLKNDPLGNWNFSYGGRRSDGSTYETRIDDRLRKISEMMKTIG